MHIYGGEASGWWVGTGKEAWALPTGKEALKSIGRRGRGAPMPLATNTACP